MENAEPSGIRSHKALVLTGGGARGAYQAGVLLYLAEKVPEAKFETLVGTSAGAINVAGLASYAGDLKKAGPVIAKLWQELEIDRVFRVDFSSLFRIGLRWLYDLTIGGVVGRPLAHSLVDTSPLRRLLEGIYRPEHVARALKEGKLRNVAVSATEVNTGSLVTFIQGQNPKEWKRARRRGQKAELSVDHLMASSAIPFLFPSSVVGKRRYVDGSIRSTSPLGPASRLGAEKIFAVGVRRYYLQSLQNKEVEPKEVEARPSVAQLAALILNTLFSESLDADAEHLERLNAMIPARQEGSFGMKRIDLLVIRPSEDLGAMARSFHDKLPALVRYLLRGIGSERGNSGDILSYLLFVPEYTKALIELGYQDAEREQVRIKAFFQD